MEAILRRDGLSLELLSSLSYKSELGISLKKNLHYFNRDELLDELNRVRKWYTSLGVLADLPVDYRIKSAQSISFKYDRYYPDHQVRKVFNDLLGFRSMVDSYDDILGAGEACLKVVDLSCGKSVDDGYRGVHVYFTRKLSPASLGTTQWRFSTIRITIGRLIIGFINMSINVSIIPILDSSFVWHTKEAISIVRMILLGG